MARHERPFLKNLRHWAVTNVDRAAWDMFPVQRFARRGSPLTTVIYTRPPSE